MKEIVIIPHGNQLKIIRENQTKICLEYKAIPIFPLFVRFENFESEFSEKIKNCCIIKIVFSENEISFFANVEFENQKQLNGKIKIGKFLKKNENICEKEFNIPFPVFKICEVDFNESESKIEWKILNEKWRKSK